MNEPRRLIAAWMQERQRLAGRLHDGPQQELAIAALEIGRLVRSGVDGDLKRRLMHIAEQLQGLQGTLRGLTAEIYPPALSSQGLAGALEAEASRAPVAVELDVRVPGRYPAEVEAVVLLSIRAAVTVAARAGVKVARVEVEAGDNLTFTVRGDGSGAEPEARAEAALDLARHWLEALGGQLDYGRAVAQGIVVSGSISADDDQAGVWGQSTSR